MITLFKYAYRDAGNYKAYGAVALAGDVTDMQKLLVKSKLEAGEFFIAEQIGITPLQPSLQAAFGGPNSDDHCWHSVDAWEQIDALPPNLTAPSSVASFIHRFARNDAWQEGLSPDFARGSI